MHIYIYIYIESAETDGPPHRNPFPGMDAHSSRVHDWWTRFTAISKM